MNIHQKKIYKVESVYEAFYTGGDIEWSGDGDFFLCRSDAAVNIFNLPNGKVIRALVEKSAEGDSQSDTVLTFTSSGDEVISAHKSGLLKLWNWKSGDLIKQWKYIHKGSVVKLAFSNYERILASGGSDSSIRVWNLEHNSCTRNLVGLSGVVSVLKINRMGSEVLIIGAADDTTIKAWNHRTGQLVKSFQGHYSKVTGLEIFENKYLVSCARDKVMILWDFNTTQVLRTLPLYESAEGLVLLPGKLRLPGYNEIEGEIHVMTAGEDGVAKIWDPLKTKEIYRQDASFVVKQADSGVSITSLLYNQATSSFAIVTSDHNIILYDLSTFKHTKQLVGFTDEILDLIYIGPNDSHIALASNSNDIKLFRVSDMSCMLLKGHKDLVVGLAKSQANDTLFASSSKDNSIRIWRLLENGGAAQVAYGASHNDTVGSVALSQASTKFLLSGSQDTTLKLWHLPQSYKTDLPLLLTATETRKAHDKDINCIAVSPNDGLVATGSLDKTAKLWHSENLSFLGTLKGHKRSIWSCVFSPIDQILMTTSADATVKLWSISDLACVKTLEGHNSSVLRGLFLSRGTQILSCGGDGLIKLWCIKTSECLGSFDGHSAKIWAISTNRDESNFVSGGCDSKIVHWKDCTDKCREEEVKAVQERMLQEQQLNNLIKSDDLIKAFKLSIALKRPSTTLKIIQDIMRSASHDLPKAIWELGDDEKNELLKYVSYWNSNTKTCYPAQVIVSIMINEITAGSFKPSLSVIESLIPYTERHFHRALKLLQDLEFLEYIKLKLEPTQRAV